MTTEFSVVYEKEGDWVIAYCLEVPEANGQGRTKDEAHQSLESAIKMIVELRREESGGSPSL